jgi:spermidine synthase
MQPVKLNQSQQLQTGLQFAIAVFLSAFLLFSVQLMTAKMLLPMLGGASAVWNTSVVFFQAVLLLGYAYTDWSSRKLSPRQQVLAQALILGIPICLLPIEIRGASLIESSHPITGVIVMLALSVGPLFFAISTLSTRLQQWLGLLGKQNPYTLYVASNAGSLMGVLSYPFIVEPLSTLRTQRICWAIAYIILVVMVMLCGYLIWKKPLKGQAENREEIVEILSWRKKILWIVLAAVPSGLLLSVTNHVTTDISPIPLFWAVPLAIYLLTFVLVFADPPLFPDTGFVLGLPLLVALIITLMGLNYDPLLPTRLIFGLHLGTFAVLTWACHSIMVKTRPHPQLLTSFYLCLSIGGVLGGAASAIIAPLIFKTNYLEYPILLSCSVLLIGVEFKGWVRRIYYGGVIGVSIFVFVGLFQSTHITKSVASNSNLSRSNRNLIVSERSFYGIHKVYEKEKVRFLTHGTTLHGIEDLNTGKERVPMGYYTLTSPIGQIFTLVQSQLKRVGVVGLGAGGLSAYAQPNQQWTFFEIDPLVEKLARQQFKFLSLSPADIQIVLGDGRLSLKKSQQIFDLLILDAFSSDSIPTHLITQEAIEIYLSKLSHDGAIAFQISNSFLKLEPVFKGVADQLNLLAFAQTDIEISEIERDNYKFASHWVVLTRPESRVAAALSIDPRWKEPVSSLLWTDNYSNLLRVLLPQGRNTSSENSTEKISQLPIK